MDSKLGNQKETSNSSNPSRNSRVLRSTSSSTKNQDLSLGPGTCPSQSSEWTVTVGLQLNRGNSNSANTESVTAQASAEGNTYGLAPAAPITQAPTAAMGTDFEFEGDFTSQLNSEVPDGEIGNEMLMNQFNGPSFEHGQEGYFMASGRPSHQAQGNTATAPSLLPVPAGSFLMTDAPASRDMYTGEWNAVTPSATGFQQSQQEYVSHGQNLPWGQVVTYPQYAYSFPLHSPNLVGSFVDFQNQPQQHDPFHQNHGQSFEVPPAPLNQGVESHSQPEPCQNQLDDLQDEQVFREFTNILTDEPTEGQEKQDNSDGSECSDDSYGSYGSYGSDGSDDAYGSDGEQEYTPSLNGDSDSDMSKQGRTALPMSPLKPGKKARAGKNKGDQTVSEPATLCSCITLFMICCSSTPLHAWRW